MPTLEVDTIVIGGGLLGWSAAYPLVKAGQRVALVDRVDEGHATQAGAGIIAPGMNVRDSETGYELRKAAIAYYNELVESLDRRWRAGYRLRAGGRALHCAQRGGSRAASRPWRKTWSVAGKTDWAMSARSPCSIPHGARALFPPLGDIFGAIHASDASRVNGRTLRDALRSACQRNGCELIMGEAELVSASESLVEVKVGSTLIQGSSVIIAAGAWSCYLAEKLGFALPIFPQRGQIVHLDMPDAYTGDWPIIVGYYDQYILTFRPNRVVCGATRESDSGYEVRLTAAGVKSVLDEALAVAPGLGNRHDRRDPHRPAAVQPGPIAGARSGAGLFATSFSAPGMARPDCSWVRSRAGWWQGWCWASRRRSISDRSWRIGFNQGSRARHWSWREPTRTPAPGGHLSPAAGFSGPTSSDTSRRGGASGGRPRIRRRARRRPRGRR